MNKKIIYRAILTLLIVAVGAAASVLVIRNREKTEQTRKTVSINSHYEYAAEKSAPHDLLITCEAGDYGLIREDGGVAAAPEYDMLMTSDYGMYYFKKGTQSGFLNSETKQVFVTEEVIATNVSEDFVIYTRDGKSGFINIKTGAKIEAVYDAVYDFSEGLAGVCRDGKVGFIDTAGELVIPYKYYSKGLYYFTSGLCSVIEGEPESGESSCYYINKNGETVIDLDCSYGMQFYEDRAFVLMGDKWYLIDKEGNMITDFAFGPYEKKMPGRFKNGYATVVADGKYGIINKNGEFTVAPKYDELLEMDDDKVVFRLGEKFGYMWKSGGVIISAVYDRMTNFKNGLSVVSLDDKFGVITDRGLIVLPNEYSKIEILDNGKLKVFTDDKTYFYTSKNGEIIWQMTV